MISFALLFSAFFLSSALADWLPNGQAEWSQRCALGAEYEGEYACFTYHTDVVHNDAVTGDWQGYITDDGTGEFSLRPPSVLCHYPSERFANRSGTLSPQRQSFRPGSEG